MGFSDNAMGVCARNFIKKKLTKLAPIRIVLDEQMLFAGF